MRERVRPGVYKTPSGWDVYVRVRPHPLIHRTYGQDVKLETVLAERAATIKDLRRRKPEPAKAGTLAKDAETYLRLVRGMPSETTRRQHIAAWVAAIGHRPRAAVTPGEIEHQIREWIATGIPKPHGSGRPISPSTGNRLRTALGHLYAKLDRGSSRPNPVRLVPKQREPEPEPRGLPIDLLDDILDAMPDRGRPVKGAKRSLLSQTKIRLRVLLWTGLRPVELMSIRAGDLDLDAGTLFVRSAKGGRRRAHPLSKEARAALAAFAEAGLFGTFSTSSVYKSWKAVLRAYDAAHGTRVASLGLRPYDLRHAYGTAVYGASGDIRATQAAMGHRNATMTDRYTLGAVPDRMRAAVEAAAEAARQAKAKRKS